MGSAPSKPDAPAPSQVVEEVEEDEQDSEPPIPIMEKKKSERLLTPPRKVARPLIREFGQSSNQPDKENGTVPKTNISRQSDVFEAASKGDVEVLTALILSNPSLLWATTTSDLNYHM
jgi:hypothetical protein